MPSRMWKVQDWPSAARSHDVGEARDGLEVRARSRRGSCRSGRTPRSRRRGWSRTGSANPGPGSSRPGGRRDLRPSPARRRAARGRRRGRRPSTARIEPRAQGDVASSPPPTATRDTSRVAGVPPPPRPLPGEWRYVGTGRDDPATNGLDRVGPRAVGLRPSRTSPGPPRAGSAGRSGTRRARRPTAMAPSSASSTRIRPRTEAYLKPWAAPSADDARPAPQARGRRRSRGPA